MNSVAKNSQRIHCILLAITFLATLFHSAAIAAEWKTVSSGVSVNLFAVYGFSDTEVFAVGEDRTILFFNGSTWTQMDTGPADVTDFMTVWGSSASDVYAAGGSSIIMHYDGTEWTDLENNAGAQLKGSWGSSGTDVYFCGTSSTVMHYDGSAFTKTTPGEWGYNDLWGTAANNIFMVGTMGTIMRFNGSGWSTMDSDGLTGHQVNGVWGSGASDVFAVANAGAIRHFNGSSWSAMDGGSHYWLTDVWGTASNDVYAVGQEGIILHYDGTEWLPVSIGTENDLNGIWISPKGVIHVVGESGTILQNGEAGPITPPGDGDYEDGYNDGYADGLAACQGTVPNPVPHNVSQPDAYLVLTNDARYTLSSGTCTKVYGTGGTNNLILQPNAGAVLSSFAGNNSISILEDSSLFLASRSGSTVTIEGGEETILVIPATATSQSIVFTDKTVSLRIEGSNVMLGATTIGTTPSGF